MSHALDPQAACRDRGRPILWHVIQLYLAQGFSELLLLTGFRADAIERFVGTERWISGATVWCLETGTDTPTGGRLRQAAEALGAGRSASPMPMASPTSTSAGCCAITAGTARCDHDRRSARASLWRRRADGDGVVSRLREKPRSDHWINGGFFCFERALLERLEPDSTLEREPLRRLAAAGDLRAFRHAGLLATAWTPTRTRCRSTSSGRAVRARGSCGPSVSAVQPYRLDGHSLLVTGAYGLLGSWLVKELLVARRPRMRPAPRPAGALGACDHGSRAPARRDRRRCLQRRAGRPCARRIRDRSVFHLAAQTIARPPPVARSRPSRRTSAAPGRCWRPAANTAPSG